MRRGTGGRAATCARSGLCTAAGVRRRASEAPRASGRSASGRVTRRLPGQREPVAVDRDLAPPLAYRKPLRRAALALLALIVALAANPAAAQTSITLVSNTNQISGGTGNLQDFDQAQAFTTGGNAAGYTLTRVNIDFASIGSHTTSYNVSIRTNNSGSPGTLVGNLTGPASLVTGLNGYTTAGIDLATNTTYFVLLDSSSASNNRVQNTTSNNEDSGGQSGWSIADGSVYRMRTSTGSWTAFDDSKRIAIKGYANSSTTTAPAIVTNGVQVTSTAVTGDTYRLGEKIEITVTFDNAVTVDTSGGTPRIQLRLDGAENRWAKYSSGTGGTALVFTYTVQSGDMDADGIWLEENFLQLQGGTIRAAADTTVAATLTYAEPGLQPDHKVNGASNDATLSALALSGVTLVPTFVSATETYTATVVNSVMQTTVTATPTHSDATVALKDGDDNPLTNLVTLAVGVNVIKAVVTAEDTTAMKTYMVTVTREATTTVPVTIEAQHDSIGAGLEDLKFTLTRTGDTTEPLVAMVTITQQQSWLGNLDLSHTLTFEVGSATAELTIGADRFSFTPSTTGNLTATVSVTTGISVGGSDTVEIVSTSAPPITVGFDKSAYTFEEDETDPAAVYAVATLDAAYPRAPSRGFALAVSTESDTARFRDDFAPVNTIVDFLAGDYELVSGQYVARKPLTDFAILDDAIYEGSEQFLLKMEFGANTDKSMVRIGKPDGTAGGIYDVIITDEEDLPVLSLSVAPPSIAEEDDDATTDIAENVSTVTVAITNDKTFVGEETVTLTFSGDATEGTHYSVNPTDADTNAAGHQVVLPAETASVPVTVTATANDSADGNRTVTVEGDLDGTAIGTRDITILDDDTTTTNDPAGGAPGIMGTPQEGHELTATLGSMADTDVLPATFPDDYDFQWVRLDSLNDPTNVGTNSSTYTVLPEDVDSTIRVDVSFTDGAGNLEGPLMSTAVGPVVALLPELSFAETTVNINETVGSVELTVNLAPASTGQVTVDYATSNGGGFGQHGAEAGEDYTAKSDTLTFIPGETSKTITIQITDDDIHEPNVEFFVVDLANPSGATESATAGRTEVHITSEESEPTASMDDVTVDEGAGTMRLTLRLSHPSSSEIRYTMSSADVGGTATVSEDYADFLSGFSLRSFILQSGELTENFDIDIIDDGAAESDETIMIEWTKNSADQVTPDVLNFTGTITDNDGGTATAPAIVTDDGVRVTSTPATGDTYGLGETIEITVTFDNAVTVDTSGGTPRIQFRLGPPPTDRWAAYSSGSGGTALVFTYTVQSGDMDADGIWLEGNFLQLQSGTIRAAADNTTDATLTYAEPGLQTEHKVNGAAPPLAPAAPGVAKVSGNPTSLKVTWSAPDNTGRPPITHYDLRYRETGTGTSGWQDGPQDQTATNATNATIGSLTTGTQYDVQVRASNADGDGPWSPSGQGTPGVETAQKGDLQLVGGPDAYSGRLEVFPQGEVGHGVRRPLRPPLPRLQHRDRRCPRSVEPAAESGQHRGGAGLPAHGARDRGDGDAQHPRHERGAGIAAHLARRRALLRGHARDGVRAAALLPRRRRAS